MKVEFGEATLSCSTNLVCRSTILVELVAFSSKNWVMHLWIVLHIIKNFMCLVRALQTWQRYLWYIEFATHSISWILRYLKGQTNMNKSHAMWIEFIESFPCTNRHKRGKGNIIVDALSRWYTICCLNMIIKSLVWRR